VNYFSYESGAWVEYPDSFDTFTFGQNATPALADLNGDGDLDLTVGNYDGTFSYFENLNIVAIENEFVLPLGSMLQTAFPNPFNPELTIQYELSESGDASLTIYDLTGAQVRRLVAGTQSIGAHTIIWRGENDLGNQVDSGVYLIVLENGGINQTQKVTYLK